MIRTILLAIILTGCGYQVSAHYAGPRHWGVGPVTVWTWKLPLLGD